MARLLTGVLALALAGAQPIVCPGGDAFKPIIIKNGKVALQFIRYGLTATHLYVPDRNGVTRDVLLGFDDATQYCNGTTHPYFGALIGRVANRISKGSFTLDGKTITVPTNENCAALGETDALHGGTTGFDRRVWTMLSYNGVSATMQYVSPDGEMGFPGTLTVNVTYAITDAGGWSLTYSATTTATTVVSLTNHAYWNLNAFVDGTETVLDHIVGAPDASTFVAIDACLLPTGAVPSVSTAFWLDFTTAKAVGRDIANGTVTPTGGYDNALVFTSWQPGAPATAQMSVMSPISGISMDIVTDRPGIQFYSGNFLDGSIPKKADQGKGFYQRWSALALEAQAHPDAVNHASFPSVVLNVGDVYTQSTTYVFGVHP